MLDWVLNIPLLSFSLVIPTGIYLFEVNNRNTGTRCEMYSKLTIKVVLVSLLILNVILGTDILCKNLETVTKKSTSTI